MSQPTFSIASVRKSAIWGAGLALSSCATPVINESAPVIAFASGPPIAAVATGGMAEGSVNTYQPLGKLVLIEPIKALQTTVIENGAPVTKYWAALSEDQRRQALDLTETVIQIDRNDISGGISHPVGSVTIDKGNYRISFAYMRYMNVPCQPANPAAGVVRVGVGIEAGMNLRSNKNKLNVGGLVPLVVAAEQNKVSGNLLIRTMGITTTSSVLSGYLGNNLQLTPESLARAMEALAVVRAVMEDTKTTTSPNYLAVSESTSGACTNIVPPTTPVLGSNKTVNSAR